jgi:hypothetical protein
MAADGRCHRFVVITRATALDGQAQQAAGPRDPIRALAQAVVALLQVQLALLSQLAELAHDRRRKQADRRETEKRVADLVNLRRAAPGVLDAPPGAEAAALPLTEVNIMVRIHVESVGLDNAGTRRRLCEQPYHHYRLDARGRGLRPSKIEVIERDSRMEGFSARVPELLARVEDPRDPDTRSGPTRPRTATAPTS